MNLRLLKILVCENYPEIGQLVGCSISLLHCSVNYHDCHAYNEPIILTMIKLLHMLDDHSVTTPSRESTQFFQHN
jgi:hypothetical protein